MESEHRILLIDDDKRFTEVFSEILREEKYIVEVALSGTEALQKLEDDFFALLIIDIGLPDMDGLMLLKAINVACPDVRKIILTGNPSMENVKTALQNGAHDYVTKPVQLQEIRDTIKAQLQVFDSDIKEKYKTLG